METTHHRDSDVHSLYDLNGNRKYLTPTERKRFIAAANRLPNQSDKIFCLTLAYSGARLSEVLNITHNQRDVENSTLIVNSLKKRKAHVFRAIPLPLTLMKQIGSIHSSSEDNCRLWPWSRTTGWAKVKMVMEQADIVGPQACPKGLRHGFAVAALLSGVPITLVSKWLGHSSLRTTAIYTEVMGAEERQFAESFWRA